MNEKKNIYSNTAEIATAGRFLSFNLGGQSYCLSVLRVREIIQIQSITRIPRTPEHIRGVINLRGKVIPVSDLRLKFKFPKADISERTCIIVVSLVKKDGSESQAGLIVDAVEEVLQVESYQIEPPPVLLGNAISADSICGMAKINQEVKLLLNIDTLVSAQRAYLVNEGAFEGEDWK